MSLDPGFIDVLKRVAGKIDRLDAELSRDAAYSSAVGGHAAELLKEIRALRGALVAPGDLEPSAEVCLYPVSAAHLSLYLFAARFLQNARKELRRTADAYSVLVKDSRANKAAWEAKEKALEEELTKLRQQVRYGAAAVLCIDPRCFGSESRQASLCSKRKRSAYAVTTAIWLQHQRHCASSWTPRRLPQTRFVAASMSAPKRRGRLMPWHASCRARSPTSR
jgi:hypothetical protein